jgi:DNA-binding response OmpR family regulator
LGDGSGLELMRHIRCRGGTPGIAVSGYATEADVQQSLDAGFAVHLAKPVTFGMLELAIHQVTAAHRAMSRHGSTRCSCKSEGDALRLPKNSGGGGNCTCHPVCATH